MVDVRPVGGALIIADVLAKALTQVARPRQVRWSIETMAAVPQTVAPRLAHAVAELVDAAITKAPSQAVTLAARSERNRLVLTISDQAPGPRSGRLALGLKPGAVLSLIRRLGAGLTASPRADGSGTDTVLTLPLRRLMD
jgi:anti-sigma regulatory factor (Ser/Thr protein kinase)